MATYTTNLNLTKSLGTENYSIDIVNANLDKIDAGCVNTTTAQAVAGVKTFSDIIIKKSSGVDMSATPSAQQTVASLDFQDKNGTAITRFRTYHETSGDSELSIILPQQGWDGSADYLQPRLRFITGGTSGQCALILSKGTNTYTPSSTQQVATIGILDAYTPMVRTSGAQAIAGEKTLQNNLIMYNSGWNTAPRVYQRKNIDSTEAPTAYSAVGGGLVIQDKNNRTMWALNVYRDTNGRDVFSIEGQAHDGTSGYFHFELSPNSRKISTNFDKPSTW